MDRRGESIRFSIGCAVAFLLAACGGGDVGVKSPTPANNPAPTEQRAQPNQEAPASQAAHPGQATSPTAPAQAVTASPPGQSYEEAIVAIATSIASHKRQFPQLRNFSVAQHCDRKGLTIRYGYKTHRARHRGGWSSGVPNPDRDGVWFYIDFHDPDSMAQIHTQPVVEPLYYGDKKVMFLILEGKDTEKVAATFASDLAAPRRAPATGGKAMIDAARAVATRRRPRVSWRSMNRRRMRSFALLLCFLTPQTALGWGGDGHRIVGATAEPLLTPQAKSAVSDLLGDESLAEATTWADDIKRDRAYRWAKRLHFITIDPAAETVDLARDCPDNDCVVSAIQHFSQKLADPATPRKERIEALKFIAHFVGDVHQPLHVGHAKDRGGNSVKVEFAGRETNLHEVWDSRLLRSTGLSWQQVAGELTADPGPAPTGTEDLSPVAWANESHAYVRGQIYQFSPGDDLEGEYSARNVPLMRDRLHRGGVRLANLLNVIFDDSTDLPFAADSQAPDRSSSLDPMESVAVLAGLTTVLVVVGFLHRATAPAKTRGGVDAPACVVRAGNVSSASQLDRGPERGEPLSHRPGLGHRHIDCQDPREVCPAHPAASSPTPA